MKEEKKAKGFTLIELLIVISLIGILTGLAAVNLIGVRGRGRDAERKSDVQSIRSAFELFRADLGGYPTQAQYNGVACNALFTGGSPAQTYMTALPCDPLNTATRYIYSPAGGAPPQTYTLAICLENSNDSDQNTRTVVAGVCPSTKQYFVANP